eukprot:Em0001g2940a
MAPKPLVIAERFRFHKREQKTDETIRAYAASLQKLTEHCEFGNALDDTLRDRLVCGMKNEKVQRRLLMKRDLTFAAAVEEMEIGEKDAAQFHGANTTPAEVHQIPKKGIRVRCYRCDGTHDARECWVTQEQCRYCEKRGHIERACSCPKSGWDRAYMWRFQGHCEPVSQGLYCFNRLAFGIASAPALWQRAIEQVLAEIPKTQCLLDDIFVAGSTDAEHLKLLDEVLGRLNECNLTINKKKSKFFQREIVYCGFRIDAEGLHKMPERVQAVVEVPLPKNVIRAFLGMCWPISIPACLSPYHLMRALYGLGVILSHKYSDGSEHPVAYASRTLMAAEQKYSQIDKEALGVVWGVKRFHQYLYRTSFTLITDHQPLTTLFSPDRPMSATAASRLQRQALFLASYSYKIQYRNTAQHANADALSRLPLETPQPTWEEEDVDTFVVKQIERLPLTASSLKQATSEDAQLSKVFLYMQSSWPAVGNTQAANSTLGRGSEVTEGIAEEEPTMSQPTTMSQVPTMSQAQTSRQTEDPSLGKKSDSPLERREAEERGSASVVTGSPKLKVKVMTLVFKQPIQLDKDTQSDVKPSTSFTNSNVTFDAGLISLGTKESSSEQQGHTGRCCYPLTTHLVQTNLRHGSSRGRDRIFEHTTPLHLIEDGTLFWLANVGRGLTSFACYRIYDRELYYYAHLELSGGEEDAVTPLLRQGEGEGGLLNMECSEEDIYTIAGYDFEWRVVGRRLLSDQRVRDIDCEGSSERDKRDKMLLEWKKAKSRDATYQALVKVLRAIENNATADRVEALEKSISQASTSNQSTTDGVVKYAEYLKGVYKVKPCGEQWLRVVSKHYINLSTIESIEDFPKEKEVTCTLAMIHAQIEEVKKLKRSITIDQVGVLGDGERARCIIVEGIPGIGKSTFSWHLGVCWTQKEILHDYHLVVLLRLRDERVQHAKCVSDLFYHYDQTTREAVVQWITSCEGDGVMMVLDGYDELSPDLQKSSIFANIIRGVVLPKMTVLVSSRPSANDNLHQLCQDQKCQYIEVIGFGKEEIQEYVDAALGHNKELRDQLMSYLEHHPHIHGLMYCPLNCAIIVQIFRDQMKSRSQPPQTLTEVYQVLIKTVLKRHEQKSVEPPAAMKHKGTSTIPNNPSTFPWLGDVSDQTIPQLLVLAKLAYDGTNEDQLIFHGPSGTMEALGLLQEVPELYLESSGSSSYHFLHKTVQEFMAALHVSSLPPGERADFIRTSFGESNMTMVVRFMAGLTKFQSQDDIEGILAFQEKVERGLLESLHWLFEAHDPGLVQKCMGHREWTLQLIGVTLDPFDCYVLGYCIANSRQPWNLLLSHCSINGQCVKMLMMVEKGRAFDYIKTIDFTFNDELGDEGSIVLVSLVGSDGCITLAFVMSVVRLQRCSINSTNIIHGIPLNVMAVTELMVAQAASTPVHWKMLRGNKVFTSLQLRNCGIGPEGLSELCSALEVNTTTLTKLDLSCNTFDSHSLAILVQLLTNNQTLEKLSLERCGLDDDAIYSLAKGLEHCKLKKLDLWNNDFTMRGVTELSHVLENHPTLTKEMVTLPYHLLLPTGLRWS